MRLLISRGDGAVEDENEDDENYSMHIPVKVLEGSARRPAVPGGKDHLVSVDGFLEFDVIDIYMARKSLRSEQSIQQFGYTTDYLCSDVITLPFSENERRNENDNSTENCFIARVVGREKFTGLSVCLSVKTRAYVVISFPDDLSKVSGGRVMQYLEAEMRKVLLERAQSRSRKAYLKKSGYSMSSSSVRGGGSTSASSDAAWDLKQRQRQEEYITKSVDRDAATWGLEVVIEYAKRGYGFYPNEKRPPTESDPTLRVQEFPFAIVFVKCPEVRDLVCEAVYRSDLDLADAGWRLAETSATPTLQFLESSGIRPCCPVRVPLNRVTFARDCYYFTTDIEGTMDFDPIDVRATHKPRSIKNPNFVEGGAHGPEFVIDILRTPAQRESPFSIGADVLSIGRKRFAVFDIETVTSRVNGFPDATRLDDATVCISVVVYDSGSKRYGAEPTTHGYVFSLSGVASERTALEDEYGMRFELIQCYDEAELYAAFRDALHVWHDVDIVSGWNTSGYDWPFIAARLKLLGALEENSRATYVSREIRRHCKFEEKTTASKAHGTRTKLEPDAPMVIHVDLMALMMKRKKLDNYSLNNVADNVLGQQKVPLPYTTMFEHWLSGDPERRRIVCAYCFEDSVLPLRIWQKELLDSQMGALARICTVLLRDVLNRGELWKSFSLMYMFAHQRGFILNENPSIEIKPPTYRLKREADDRQDKWVDACAQSRRVAKDELARFTHEAAARAKNKFSTSKRDVLLDKETKEVLAERFKLAKAVHERAEAGQTFMDSEREKGASTNDNDDDDDDDDDGLERAMEKLELQGATVLDSIPGMRKHVLVFDFQSLYPSCIIDQNICSSTLADRKFLKAPGWSFHEVPIGNDQTACFVTAACMKAITALMCAELLAERVIAKREMAEAFKMGDSALGAVHNGRQNALKICANSIYGALGAPNKSAKYACLVAACAVTGRGRLLIDKTKRMVEEVKGLVVCAGDTDSVFVDCDHYNVHVSDPVEREVMLFAKGTELTRSISAFFGERGCINLTFEKIYVGYMCVSKKRYFGLKKEKIADELKMESKGVCSVRRSSPAFQRNLFTSLQNSFLYRPDDIDERHELVRTELQRLVEGHGTVAEFTRTCQLKAEYAAPQPQTIVRDLIKRRSPGTEPRAGDRVAYVMRRVNGKIDAKTIEMAEDPMFVEKNGLPLAIGHYISSFRTSIEQLFEVAAQCPIKRVRLLFDQAEDISNSQTLDVSPPHGSRIRDFRDQADLALAKPSRQCMQESRANLLVVKREDQQVMVARARELFGLSPAAQAKDIIPDKKKQQSKRKRAEGREIELAKRARNAEAQQKLMRSFFRTK